LRHILCIFGARPKAIELCPLVRRLRSEGKRFSVKVCVTAQHRDMRDQVLQTFSVTPDYDLNLMQPGQTKANGPDLVVVPGDTTTTMAAGPWGRSDHRMAVAHVEAGLRTGDLRQPFPEEMNRVLTTRLAAIHFALVLREKTERPEAVEAAAVRLGGDVGDGNPEGSDPAARRPRRISGDDPGP
jgi:UDP-N-acetylglucosamine 2-epimerase (non-hydrolysing)